MRPWLVVTGLLSTLAVALCFVPLFDLLGYEFAFALALVAGPLAILVGLTIGRDGDDGAKTLGRAVRFAVLGLLPPLGVILLNAVRVKNCDFLDGFEFFLLLPVLSAGYGAALGVLVAQLTRVRSPRLRRSLAISSALLPLALSLAKLYTEPPIVAFDHLFGYFAGSLYDEVVRVDARVLAFRATTFLRIVCIGLFLAAFARRRTRGLTPVGLVLALGLCVCTTAELWAGPTYGFRVSRADIERALPIVEKRPGLVIHLPEGTPKERRAAVADDHAFRLAELLRRLDVQLAAPIHSYVYANADEKARLMGGRNTMIAKPWLREIHVHDVVAPHDVVPHELAHAVAASFGSSLLRVSARYGVLVNMGLVEGLAEALTPPRGELDLDAWSQAMRSLKMAPDMRKMLGPAGFWTEAPRRAYTIAGSFVRYLLDTYGAAPLKQAYAAGDFEAAYKKALPTLVDEWEAYLDARTIAPYELHLAEDLFKTPSIFARPCAHEIAELRERASRAPAPEAVLLYERICKHLDDIPPARYELAMAQRRAGALETFLTNSAELLEKKGLTTAQALALREGRGEVLWQRDAVDAAKDEFTEVLNAKKSSDSERLQWVRLWALSKPEPLRRELRDFLAEKLAPVVAVLRLEAAWRADPSDRTLPYLIARQLIRAGACKQAEPYLESAAEHPFMAIELERLRLLAECAQREKGIDEAIVAQERYLAAPLTSGERERANDQLARLRWQKSLR